MKVELSEIDQEAITIGDPRLPSVRSTFKPYTPFNYLDQAYCKALHKGKFTTETNQKQNHEHTGPHDAVKCFMQLKELGVKKYEFTCMSSSLKKGKTKLALGILVQMYGKDKKWKELQAEMEAEIIQKREERGAGDKPVLKKNDPMEENQYLTLSNKGHFLMPKKLVNDENVCPEKEFNKPLGVCDSKTLRIADSWNPDLNQKLDVQTLLFDPEGGSQEKNTNMKESSDTESEIDEGGPLKSPVKV